jgi:hypothetical protein
VAICGFRLGQIRKLSRAPDPSTGCAAPADGRWCPSSISRRDRSAGSMPRCRAASPCSDPIRSGRASAGLGDDRGDAGTLGGRVAGTDDHTSDSARSVVGADPPGQLRRSHSPASQAPADHRAAVGVNRDASLFCRAPGSDLVVQHGGAGPLGRPGSVVRRIGWLDAGPAGHSPRHSKPGRGHSSCRSVPGRGSRRTETAALMPRRHGRNRDRHVDDRHDCRDSVPACVPSTVSGTASMRNCQVEIGAVLALR